MDLSRKQPINYMLIYKEIAEKVDMFYTIKSDDKQMELKLNQHLEALTQSFITFGLNGNDLTQLSQCLAISEKLTQTSKLFRLTEINTNIEVLLNELKNLTEELKTKLSEAMIYTKTNCHFGQQIKTKINFYDLKREEYYSEIKAKENKLNDIGFSSELKTKTIEDMKNNNSGLKKVLDSTQQRINFYNFEPNNESLKEKISQMKHEIETMNNSIDLTKY